MANRKGLLALAGTAVGLGVGIAAERSMLNRRRRNDPEGGVKFGTRRGDRSHKFALRDGASTFVEEFGPESPTGVVFVHGSALRTDLWHYQMDSLAHRHLVMYDMRGHGLSERGTEKFTIETLADDLLEVLDETGLEEAVIVGHSVGGMVALDFAIRNRALLGDRIKGLALLNTTYGPAVETLAGGAAVSRFERVTRRPFDMLGTQAEKLQRLRKVIRPSDAIFWGVAFTGFGPGCFRQADRLHLRHALRDRGGRDLRSDQVVSGLRRAREARSRHGSDPRDRRIERSTHSIARL